MFILQPREIEKLELWADFKGHDVCAGFHKHGLNDTHKDVLVIESSEPRGRRDQSVAHRFKLNNTEKINNKQIK
jgi:hypothetical protein